MKSSTKVICSQIDYKEEERQKERARRFKLQRAEGTLLPTSYEFKGL